jgi:glutamine synthetase
MIRIPSMGGRIECRAADIACNPYLGSALILAAGLEGIREGLDAGDPHHENMYNYSDAEIAKRGIKHLPRNLGEAVEAFEADPLAKEVFGEAMFKSFVDFKKGEWESYQNHVSSWEVDRYLKMF